MSEFIAKIKNPRGNGDIYVDSNGGAHCVDVCNDKLWCRLRHSGGTSFIANGSGRALAKCCGPLSMGEIKA